MRQLCKCNFNQAQKVSWQKITELSNLLKTSHPDEMKFIKPWQPILGCVKKPITIISQVEEAINKTDKLKIWRPRCGLC